MRILLAIDGSNQSTHAIHALAHFRPPDELSLVHALELPDLDHPMVTPEMRDEVLREVEEKLRPLGEELLNKASSALPSDVGRIQRIHQSGAPAQVILETARSAYSDVIILGARGLGSLKELVLGSVSHRVVVHATCSTLVVKTSMPTLRNILLPIEGKEDAAILIKFLASKPFRQPVDVTVFTVWPQPRWPWPVTLGQSKLLEERALEHAQVIADEIALQLQGLDYHATATVGLGSPSFAILQQQVATKPDLIMMSSHGRKGMSRFLIGSVSHAVTHQASCPVLIVR